MTPALQQTLKMLPADGQILNGESFYIVRQIGHHMRISESTVRRRMNEGLLSESRSRVL